jgi:hypothetical protein
VSHPIDIIGLFDHAWVGTIGQLKNDIHKGIIERILQTALWVAASGRAQISHQSPNTFNTYSDAVQELPEELVAGMPRSLLEVGIWHASDATGRFDSDDYGWVQQQKRFDWKAFLAYVHRDKGAGAVDSGDSIEKENAISSAESKKTAQTQKKESTSDSSPVSTLDVVEPTETEAISDQERVGFESPDDTGAE